MVLNAAARFVVGAGKFQHITPVLGDVPSTVFVALAQHTSSSSTSARRFQTSLVGHTSVLPNAATCWFLAPELSRRSFPVAALELRLELSSGTSALDTD